MWLFALLPGHRGNLYQSTEIESETQEMLFLTLYSLNLQFHLFIHLFLFFKRGSLVRSLVSLSLQWSSKELVSRCGLLSFVWITTDAPEQALAGGRRGPGLECGKCPHPSSPFGALSGREPLSAAGRHPGTADGGASSALRSFILSAFFLRIWFFERN